MCLLSSNGAIDHTCRVCPRFKPTATASWAFNPNQVPEAQTFKCLKTSLGVRSLAQTLLKSQRLNTDSPLSARKKNKFNRKHP